MIGSWSNEALIIYAHVREEITLVPGTAAYTMGPTGDLVTTRPMKIENAMIRDESASTPIEYPVNILSQDEWANIIAKSVSITIPNSIYIEGTFPNETINVYPVPAAAKKLVLMSTKALTEIATLDTEVSFPPGYYEALKYNLAIRLSDDFGRPLTESIVSIASESKASLKRNNHRPSYLRVDPALLGRRVFNILTGGYNR
jgi:hypothetical protein